MKWLHKIRTRKEKVSAEDPEQIRLHYVCVHYCLGVLTRLGYRRQKRTDECRYAPHWFIVDRLDPDSIVDIETMWDDVLDYSEGHATCDVQSYLREHYMHLMSPGYLAWLPYLDDGINTQKEVSDEG